MQVAGKVVVVTGGANGIGRALCEAFHRAGAAKVVVVDLDLAGAEAVAASIDGAAFKCDVGQENDILVGQITRDKGKICLRERHPEVLCLHAIDRVPKLPAPTAPPH